MFLVALGCIWGLQGLGLLQWPADSFMLGDADWAARGIGSIAGGAALIALVEWRKRR